ncbi:helix-turn-helix transcriptional regulator [Shewanella sp. MEBiC00475]|uniref:ArsR/SmtB family transcription factor n=1 Tax=Shewanella sp. MEBiC00475 TaxID=2575361 RepID=UPI0010BF84E6|nr:metalloregulator ArsR/SmtB family transcription factor [Shewanella sp. MEBiC00475]
MNQRIKIKANIFKALGHPTRLWIVEQLAVEEKCVCEFVDAFDVDFSTISKHLSVLRNAGIVDIDKRGKQIFYHLTMPCLLSSIGCIDTLLDKQIQAQITLID